ncbi:MAG TPA: MerC domain-containing protein [Saprospiraceae bacterium]|jgi:hypothetical protein|nr:MerC domain-containing protein [Saprospiraceae bacterium]HRG22017.1 MerC domain-containing protein [Saprospiraceae bacterium]HRG64390.1 MerC domain-containing protein [Saprospiraceae bacterium]
MSSFFKLNLDFAGMAASAICAIHCMAMPLILSLGVAHSGHLFHDHTFDIAVIAIGIVIASISLISDFKKHRSFFPLGLVIVGFSVLTYGLTHGHGGIHLWISLLGSALVSSAHFINWRKNQLLFA